MLLLFVVVLLACLHREIIFEVLQWALHATATIAPAESDRVRGHLKRIPKLYLTKEPAAEVFVVDRWSSTALFVAQGFWDELDSSEKQALIAWAQSAADRASAIRRIFGEWNPITADRDCLLIVEDPLALPRLVDKAQIFRDKFLPTTMGVLLSGLTFLGPGLLKSKTSSKERAKAYVDQLTRIKK